MTDSTTSRLIGISGHQNLTPETRRIVGDAIIREIGGLQVVGLTSLAGGADQVFADAVLGVGGKIMAVLPSANYESSFQSEKDLAGFKRLIEVADSVVRMPFAVPSEEAYLAAGQEMVRRSEQLIAVWDGRPAKGSGGTGDIVEYARSLGKLVTVIWPEGAARADGES